MISEANMRSIREITEVLGVYFKGTTDKEAKAFIRKYEPAVNEMLDLVVLADKCYMEAEYSDD